MASISNDAMNTPFIPNSISFPYNTANENLMQVTPTPIYSNYIGSRAFDPSHDAVNTPFTPALISSPSASSASSDIQSGITQTQAYSSDNYFVQYPDHVVNNSYTRQSAGDATDGSYGNHDCFEYDVRGNT